MENKPTQKKSTSETGHNKNVTNFEKAIKILQEMSSLYQPVNTNLQLGNLIPIASPLVNSLHIIQSSMPTYKNAVAKRATAIKKLPTLVTRSYNSAISLELSKKDKENLSSLSKKIKGVTSPTKKNTTTEGAKTNSTSQLSYDNRIANFNAYIKQLQSHPVYAPNESDITIAALYDFHTTLTNLNKEVNNSNNTLITARKNRDVLLYHGKNNVIELMIGIKNYVKSIGEAALPYYKELVKLKFSKH